MNSIVWGTAIRRLGFIVLTAMMSQPSFACYPVPDTAKAAVLDDLCVLGVKGAVWTSIVTEKIRQQGAADLWWRFY